MGRHEIVDMFAEHPSTGSRLGVVPDAAGLSTEQMRDVADEIPAVETTFVLPPTDPGSTYRVRVFGSAGETPYGAHSAVGTAATLVRLGRIPAGPAVQECGEAVQRVIATEGNGTLVADGPPLLTELDPAPLLAATVLTSADLEGADAAWSAGFGAGFAFVHVRNVGRAKPDHERLRADNVPAVCLFTWDASASIARARVFAPGFGIPEDPACAPIAAALGGLLVGTGRLPSVDGRHRYHVRQGAEVGRPALLDCAVTVRDGRVVQGEATGRVIPATAGRARAGNRVTERGRG